ncbi:MAG: TetR/AcrR family transcriptional regulator [Bacteroidota bacterium]
MSPRSAKQLEEIREQSKQAILAAAMELFAQHGFDATSISQIAKKANVSKGLIYNYFEKKEDLMTHIVMNGLEEGNSIMEEMGSIESAEGKFRHLIEVSFQYMKERTDYSKLMVGISLQLDSFPELTQIVEMRYQSLMPLFGGLLAEIGVPQPEEEALAISAMLDGIGLQYLVLGDALPLDRIKAYIYQRIIHTD